MGHIALSVWFRADRVYLESNKLTLATPIYGIITDIWFLTSAECRSCIKEFCSSVSEFKESLHKCFVRRRRQYVVCSESCPVLSSFDPRSSLTQLHLLPSLAPSFDYLVQYGFVCSSLGYVVGTSTIHIISYHIIPYHSAIPTGYLPLRSNGFTMN